MYVTEQLRTITIWLYIRRYKATYWSLVTVFFMVESIDRDYRATTGLLFFGLVWWLYKLFKKPTGNPLQ